MNLAELHKPFPPERISWRVGSTTKDKSKGMALAYIDARDVQDRLDDVCGPANWQCRYPHANGKTVCEVGIRIPRDDTHEWVWKSDGAGDSDIEAEKGALSDAFKRAAVRWGIGRYLYDLESPWVELETYEKGGQTYVKGIKQGEFTRLRALLGGKKTTPPAHGLQNAPKTHSDEDVEQGVRNWTALRRGEIDEASRLPELYQFLDANEAGLLRLKSKHPSAYAGLMRYYQDKYDILNKKEVAA